MAVYCWRRSACLNRILARCSIGSIWSYMQKNLDYMCYLIHKGELHTEAFSACAPLPSLASPLLGMEEFPGTGVPPLVPISWPVGGLLAAKRGLVLPAMWQSHFQHTTEVTLSCHQWCRDTLVFWQSLHNQNDTYHRVFAQRRVTQGHFGILAKPPQSKWLQQ